MQKTMNNKTNEIRPNVHASPMCNTALLKRVIDDTEMLAKQTEAKPSFRNQ